MWSRSSWNSMYGIKILNNKNFYCLGGDDNIVVDHNIYTQTTTSTLKPEHLHSNKNIYTQTTTSTLKPQHLHSNHNIYTQITTYILKPQHLHSNHNIYTQTITSTLRPQHLLSDHNIYPQTTTSTQETICYCSCRDLAWMNNVYHARLKSISFWPQCWMIGICHTTWWPKQNSIRYRKTF